MARAPCPARTRAAAWRCATCARTVAPPLPAWCACHAGAPAQPTRRARQPLPKQNGDTVGHQHHPWRARPPRPAPARYQLHWPERYAPLWGQRQYNPEGEKGLPNPIPFEETVQAIGELIKEGKVKHWGLSNETAFGEEC